MTTKAYYHILISVILYETDVFVYYLYIYVSPTSIFDF